MFFYNSKQISLYLLTALLLFNNAALASEINANATINQTVSSDNDIKLNINNTNKQHINLSAPKKIDGQLYETDKDKAQKAFELQKKMDIADLQALWASTIERNNVVKFAIKKLTMPPEQRRVHSSLMARTLSTLVSGVSILPSLFGADVFTSTGSSVAGRVTSRIIDKKTMPKELPLTDTELIKLAETIEDLQDRIIKSYYDYKSSIEALEVCRQNIVLQNINYSNAIKSKNDLAIIASSALYDKELLNELRLTQEIKLHRIELERLAGPETVDNLNLGKITTLNSTTSSINNTMATPKTDTLQAKTSEVQAK